MVILYQQVRLIGHFTEQRKRTTFALTKCSKVIKSIGIDQHHVTFLRLVTPDLQRRHAAVGTMDITQLKLATHTRIVYQFWHRIGEPTGTNIVNAANWVVLALTPASINHFLTATLHLRVMALYRIKIQVSRIGAGCH